ncbi:MULTISPECIES: DinB family protein [Bacillus]|uniref:Formate dehydrogenase n=2 Tax=Bacillus TaxID=1386 RepID=A0A0M4FIK0_9BACI|nr:MULTISPECIES: DinB family protein [Bacillus]ALC82749.1 formate dehydrogenase [Bacillus gobiensis]MBP1081703.1 putative damage-inducible protein DinB [Bacillus capparidis]MED1096356.1 DinB family protein [Bacillus capparidis]
MNHLLFKQFEMTRGWLIEAAESVSQEKAKVQPDGFNNTIQWHIGHVLTVTDQLMFGISDNTIHLPAHYVELFATGTQPTDWKAEAPSLDELITKLKDQPVHLQQLPSERLNDAFETPFLGHKTFGEITGFVIVHEAIHIGKIEEMKRVIEHSGL